MTEADPRRLSEALPDTHEISLLTLDMWPPALTPHFTATIKAPLLDTDPWTRTIVPLDTEDPKVITEYMAYLRVPGFEEEPRLPRSLDHVRWLDEVQLVNTAGHAPKLIVPKYMREQSSHLLHLVRDPSAFNVQRHQRRTRHVIYQHAPGSVPQWNGLRPAKRV